MLNTQLRVRGDVCADLLQDTSITTVINSGFKHKAAGSQNISVFSKSQYKPVQRTLHIFQLTVTK